VAVLVLRTDVASPVERFLVADQERLDAGAAVELARRLGPTLGEGGALMILPDPTNLDPCGLLAGVAETLGPLPVLGGVAAGSPLFELYNTDAARGTLPGLAFPRVRPVVGVAQGCQPIGEPYVITRAEGNVIRAIAGHPAVEVLREAIHSLSGFEGRLRHAGIFAGLAINPAKSPLERGDFLVRNLVGVEPETGAVAVADHVRVGQTIQFQIRDGEAARDDLEAMLARAAVDLGGREPAFGVYFNCTGRGRGLYGAPDHDVTRIRGGLGKWPLIGFFGNGEFAPVGDTNFFHNYTGVLVLFPQL
jgi:small ligand-binding sensory domain FIST